MNNQVKITLTSLNGDVELPERSFLLNPDQAHIDVGRASKNQTKGLHCAADNAWFDSPVMSRRHARISYNADEKAVMLMDTGSMHGTFLNNVQIPAECMVTITNDDEVKFGAQVSRGSESFAACRFRVDYEFVHYKPGNSYKFPEYSEGEEEEEDDDDEEVDSSEDEDEFNPRGMADPSDEEIFNPCGETDTRGRASSEDGASTEIESPAMANISIDLTGDESPVRGNLIDLTAEEPTQNPTETAFFKILNGRPTDISESASSSHIAVYAGNPMTVCEESDEEGAHFSSDSEDQLEDEDPSDVESSYSDIAPEAYIADPIGNGESDNEYPEDYPMDNDDEDDEDEVHDEQLAMTSIHQFANATHGHTVVRLSEPPNDESSADEDECESESDVESDFGLSEVGEEGLRALRDGGLLETPVEPLLTTTAPSQLFRSAEHSYHTASHAAHVLPTSIEMPDRQAYFSLRQPSPSDAAMVKTRASVAPLQVSSPVKTMGDMSGKAAFFEAREINKQKFASEKATPAKLSSQPLPPGLQLPPKVENEPLIQQYGAMNPTLPFATHYLDGIGHFRATQTIPHPSVDSTMARRGECAFLDMPDTTPLVNRAASPQPDMTSAVTYSAGKQLLAAKSAPKTSVLKIQELCSEPLMPVPNLKRKAEEISIESSEELRTWGNGVSHTVQTVATTAVSTADPSRLIQNDNPRPAKRFRKFMENMGYVALGGVAVGGALFSALIATAPEFA